MAQATVSIYDMRPNLFLTISTYLLQRSSRIGEIDPTYAGRKGLAGVLTLWVVT